MLECVSLSFLSPQDLPPPKVLHLLVVYSQTETVDVKYQPRYTARDTYNRKIDLVVGLPEKDWTTYYNRLDAYIPDHQFSHIAHSHTGARVLGFGCEVKAPDGNFIEAEVQLGVWMSGLFSWMLQHRREAIPLPPVVGCVSMGSNWEFYIAYYVEETHDSPLPTPQVCIWGPLSDLCGRGPSHRAVRTLATRLRRVMRYVCGDFTEQLLKVIVSG